LALVVPCDVGQEGELEAVFKSIAETWGGLDIALHSIAFALKEDLQGPLLDSSSEGFKVAMDICRRKLACPARHVPALAD
jgi:enoyl-[acyl-carrier protein] reductase I